jgi:hypothetical protein
VALEQATFIIPHLEARLFNEKLNINLPPGAIIPENLAS